ncbi:MAG: prolyl oligopeptidase family serine peptidase [Chitinophagales bacterium]|nr:prolyl oligopeptidase family serine peptidase [Chitinophagales bacterium]
MKNILFFITLGTWGTMSAQNPFIFPNTQKIPVIDTLHGLRITDNYRWLEDKKNPAVVNWTKAQHEATLSYVNKNYPMINGLKEEITAYLDRDYIGPVFLSGEQQFFYARKQGELQNNLYAKVGNAEVLIFDPEKIDPTGKTSITDVAFTENNDKCAVSVQYKGAEIETTYIIDPTSGKDLGEKIENLRSFVWAKDGKSAYITTATKESLEKQEPQKTYLHILGQPREQDVFIGAPNDPKNYFAIYESRYSNTTFIQEGDFYSNSLKIKTYGTSDVPKLIFSSDKYSAEPDAIDDRIYIKTNFEAPNYKLMVADKNNPDFANWKTLIPEGKTVFEAYVVTKNYILVQDKKDVVSRLLQYDLKGKFIKEWALPEVGSVGKLEYNRETNAIFVTLNTFTKPTRIYRIDANTQVWSLFYEMTSPLKTADIEAKIDFYTSHDGTKVPLFIMYKKGTVLDGNNPTLLYGYGGFQIAQTPTYVGLTSTFINRGGVYAIACIRGGDEYGENWHLDGMLDKKQNSFDDFIAAAEYLISQKYTQPTKLAIKGGSNGGLLVGAMLTQRPDLYKTAICGVPLLDMVRYHKFLIARYWIPEYGDPDSDHDFRNILQYSPYHNIKQGIDYPTTLIIAGENDTRVDPLHAKKMTAALQNNIGQENPIMLYIDYDSGHGSGKSIQQTIDFQEFQLRFLMHNLGMN